MIRREFIKKNLITAYFDSFNAVWVKKTTDDVSLEKIENILKYLEKETPEFEKIINELLQSENDFEAFIGAYLGIKYKISLARSKEKLDYLERKFENESPKSVNGKIYFYITVIKETL